MPSLPCNSLPPAATWLSIVAFGLPGPGKVPLSHHRPVHAGNGGHCPEAERVATVAWANHEVPLALGIVPVGYTVRMSDAKVTFASFRTRLPVGLSCC